MSGIITPSPSKSQALTALQVIAWVGYLGGVLLVIVGIAMNNDYNSYLAETNPLKGIPVLIVGGAFLNAAILATFSLLIIAAVKFVAPAVPKVAPVRGPLRIHIKPENGHQLSVYDREVWLEGVGGGSLRGVTAKLLRTNDSASRNEISVTGPAFDFIYTAENPPSDEQAVTFQEVVDFINRHARELDGEN